MIKSIKKLCLHFAHVACSCFCCSFACSSLELQSEMADRPLFCFFFFLSLPRSLSHIFLCSSRKSCSSERKKSLFYRIFARLCFGIDCSSWTTELLLLLLLLLLSLLLC